MVFFQEGGKLGEGGFQDFVTLTERMMNPFEKGRLGGEVFIEFAEEGVMRPVGSVFRGFFGMEKVVHMRLLEIPEKCGVVDKPVFLNVLRVATTFFLSNDVVIFAQVEVRNAQGLLVKLFGPTQDGFGVAREGMDLFLKNKRDEEGVGINNDSSSSTVAFDKWDGGGDHFIVIDELLGFA